jgi:hypothetical protein
LALSIERDTLLPYLRSESASHRVTEYIAYQVSPKKGLALDFVASLRREKAEAASKGETRPLWQLLVCIGELMRLGIGSADAEVLRKALSEHLAWMRHEPSVDPAGECKQRIELLLRK